MTHSNIWYKLPAELVKRDDLSLSDKFVYTYMLYRYSFFVLNQKKSYYESQETIASALNLSKRTVATTVKNLIRVGLVRITEKTFTGSVCTNKYYVDDLYKIYLQKKPKGRSFQEMIDEDEDNIF